MSDSTSLVLYDAYGREVDQPEVAPPKYSKRYNLSQYSDQFYEGFVGGYSSKAASGETVNEDTALAVAAFFAGIRAISEDISKMPIRVVDVKNGVRTEVENHPVTLLLNETPNPETNAFYLKETLVAHALAWGGGYLQVIRSGAGIPLELWLLNPTGVVPWRESTGEFTYHIRNFDPAFNSVKTTAVLDPSEVVHLHGLGFDSLTGYRLVTLAKQCLGKAIAIDKANGAYFGNGLMPSGVLEVPMVLSDTAYERLRESMGEMHGGADKAHKHMILEEGMKWNTVSLDPEKSQLVQSQQITIEDVARWLRIPLSKLHHLLKANFNTLEMQNEEYYKDTLFPWTERIRVTINQKLIRPIFGPTQTLEFDASQLIQGNQNDRSTYYREQLNIGAVSPNEVRAREGRNPIPEGDSYWMQSAMAPTKSLLEINDLRVEEQRLKNELLQMELEDKKKAAEEADEVVEDPENPFAETDNTDETDDQVGDDEESDTESADDSEGEDTEETSEEEEETDEDEDEDEKRALELRKSFYDVFEQAFIRFVALEADKVTRARKKDTLTDLLNVFYPDHAKHIELVLNPLVRCYIRAYCLQRGENTRIPENFIDFFLTKAVNYHISQSKDEIRNKTEAFWKENRPSVEAQYIVDTLDKTLRSET